MRLKMAILCGAVVGMVFLAACSGSSGSSESSESSVSSGSSESAVSSESGRNKGIDLDDYVVVTFEGYDGIGTATVEIDYAALESDYGNKIKVNRSKKDELPDDYVFQYIEEYTDVSVSPDSELSNGDNVKLIWDVNDEFFDEYLNNTFLYSDKTIEVSGLDETGTVDVFDGVDVLFSGVAPVGEARISVDNDYGSGQYTLDKDSDLSNGDVVTVTYDFDIDRFIEERHAVPESTSKEFTVYGLDSYITDMSQLSEEDLNSLKEDSLNKTKKTVTTTEDNSIAGKCGIINWEGYKMGGVTRGEDYVLENIYFLSPKVPGQSRIIFVYSLSVTLEFGDENRAPETTRMYWPVEYNDLIQEEDGSLVGMSKGTCNFYTAVGDMDTLYKEYISDTKDDYVATIYDAELNVVQ